MKQSQQLLFLSFTIVTDSHILRCITRKLATLCHKFLQYIQYHYDNLLEKLYLLTLHITHRYSAALSPSLSISLAMDVQPSGSWSLFQFLNPVHSRCIMRSFITCTLLQV
jgi:hypothetical protein